MPKPRTKIREFRKKKRLKQAALANKVGIFQSEISDIENGKRKPNICLARKIASQLGAKVDEIFLP